MTSAASASTWGSTWEKISKGEGHGGMPEAPRDDRRVDALGQGETGVGVAQSMQAGRRQCRGHHQAAKQGADAFRVKLRAILGCEDPPAVDPGIT